MEIIIKVSLGEIIRNYDWDKLCLIKGWNQHIVNEGVADSNEITEISIAEARFIGINVLEIFKEKAETTICPQCLSEIDDEDMLFETDKNDKMQCLCRNCHQKIE